MKNKGFLSFPHDILFKKKGIKDCTLYIYIQNSMKMNLMYAYIFLAFAIVLEITGTSLVKDTVGFTRWMPSIICLVTICFSYYLMSHVVNFIPIGITYATWSGLGIAAITIIGIFKYNQIPNVPTIIGLIFIISGVIIVNTMNDIKVN